MLLYTVAAQVFFAATNLLYASGRSCRHTNALCLLLHRYSGWPASLGSSKLQLQCTGGWNASCSCTFFFVLIFAISHDSLTPLMRHCLPDASPPCTKHFALCSSFALKWPASWPNRHQLAVYCRLECSVQSHLSSYWQCDRSCFSWCRRCASVCLPPA